MKLTFVHNNKEYVIDLEKSGENYTVRIGDITSIITDVHVEHNLVIFTMNGTRFAAYHARQGAVHHFAVAGEDYTFKQITGARFKNTGTGGQQGDSVSSPMPGLVVKIQVMVGDNVEEGMTLAIVEAMKMQNELRAPRNGKVRKVNCKEGDQIDALQPIVELE